MAFKRGDCVVLKSGGPVMTVKGIGKYGMASIEDEVACTWFDGTKLKEGKFIPETIKLRAESYPSIVKD